MELKCYGHKSGKMIHAGICCTEKKRPVRGLKTEENPSKGGGWRGTEGAVSIP